MNSTIGLIIQFSGVLQIALLLTLLTNSLKSVALKYWKYAWFFLCLALISLAAAFEFKTIAKPFYLFYYLSQYAFGGFLVAGCRNYASGKEITARHLFLLIPASLAAAALAFSSGNFNDVFGFHSLIMAALFAIAFFALKPSRKFSQKNTGGRVMRFALSLLALDFFHYAVFFSLRHTSYPKMLGKYMSFNSAIDLVLEILLGFGMVIVLLEKVRRDVEETNDKLEEARAKLEQAAHVDPLTAAFTRHAFYSFLQRYGKETDAVSGCVGVFDIDNLKPINDGFGHAAGDVAISRTARAIRSVVRADDLLFRWGGDEFFVVMLGFDTAQAVERMCGLDALLKDVELFGVAEKVSIGVSFGFADFGDIGDLEKSIKEADAEMYRAKQQSKCADKTERISASGFLPPHSAPSTGVHP